MSFHHRATEFVREYLALVRKHDVCIVPDWYEELFVVDMRGDKQAVFEQFDTSHYPPSGSDTLTRGITLGDHGDVRIFLNGEEIFEEG